MGIDEVSNVVVPPSAAILTLSCALAQNDPHGGMDHDHFGGGMGGFGMGGMGGGAFNMEDLFGGGGGFGGSPFGGAGGGRRGGGYSSYGF